MNERTLAVDEYIARNEKRTESRHVTGNDGEPFLTDDVRLADLTKYSEAALEGRLAQYERDYTFETCPRRRAEFKREAQRTRIELNKRKLYRRKEAERVFEL